MLKDLIKAFVLLLVSVSSNAFEVCSKSDLKDALPLRFLPASFDKNVRGKFDYQLSVVDPLGKEPTETVQVIPDMSLSLTHGVLSGRDRGEFGGELSYRGIEDRKSLVIMDRNIRAIYGSGKSAIVIYSYSHMLTSEGKIFLFSEKPGVLAICEVASYQDEIKSIRAVGEGTISYNVSGAQYVIDSQLKIENR